MRLKHDICMNPSNHSSVMHTIYESSMPRILTSPVTHSLTTYMTRPNNVLVRHFPYWLQSL